MGDIGKALEPFIWVMAGVLLLPYFAWFLILRRSGNSRRRYLRRSAIPFLLCTCGYIWLFVSTKYENLLSVPGVDWELEEWYPITLFVSGGYLVLGSVLADARHKVAGALLVILGVVWLVPYSTFAVQVLNARHAVQIANSERERLLKILYADAVFHPKNLVWPVDYRNPVGVTVRVGYKMDLVEVLATVKQKEDANRVRALVEGAAPLLPVRGAVYVVEGIDSYTEVAQFTVQGRR